VKRSAAHDRWGLAVGAAFLALYAATAARGLQFADSGELQSVALLGGIPHATGYPLWVALARAFSWLPLGEPEFRVTLFSAVCGAAALGLLVRRLGELGVAPFASVAAAGFLGLTFSFWRISVRAEVYTLGLLTALVALGALVAARAASPSAWAARRAALLLGLVLTVHLAFAPAVAVAGLGLAWREWRAAPRELARLPLLLAAFALGLSPYLLLVALDASGIRANYLDLVRENAAFMGHAVPPLETPWQGVRWLLTGRNLHPPPPFELHPRSVVAMLPDCGAVLFLFELGPLALPLLLAGLVRAWRKDRPPALVLAVAFLATVGFAAWLQFGAMLHLFLLPACLIGAILAAFGLEALLGVARLSGPRRAAVAVAACLALAAAPAGLRVFAERHPIGPREWRVIEEDAEFRSALLPAVARDAGAGAWADSALERFPEGALVLASWSYYTPLRHRQLVDGRRPDLTLRQILVGTLAPRVRGWQRDHVPAGAPIVLVAERARLSALLPAADSLALPGGRVAWVLRRPVPDSLLEEARPGR